jgi:serine/threonine-protein kinase
MLRTPDLAGRALDDRYELHAAIGEGGFGRVYRGVDRRLGRTVAVKVIKPWWAEDSAWVDRFQREAQLLARMSDPGIVQIFDIGHAEEGPYFVAELVDGESLSERLLRGPLPPADARAVAEQLCRALGSAHAQGVVHCDVKPANVMLALGGRVKVGDFGVARLAEGTSQALSATIAGTPRYMSPEQARGRHTTAATDVYSAGVVLYEMLAGRPPFERGSAVELGLCHLQDEPPPLPSHIPVALREIVARALAKDPADRYSDGVAMAAALHAADTAPEPVTVALPRRAPGGRAERAAAAVADPPTIDLTGATVAVTGPTALLREPPAPPSPPQPPERRNHGSARRRRRIALLLALLPCALLVFLLTRAGAKTTVPELRGLPAGGVRARAKRTHVHPAFSRRYAASPVGLAISQRPAAGTRVAEGSSVRVVLSAGPPPVRVPGVVGRSASSAESLLASAGLRYGVTLIAAPGSATGDVIHQSPGAASTVAHGSTVTISVAESPRWRALTAFSGVDDGRSVAFRIRGKQWRVTYSMSYQDTCLLIVTCFGPSAQARSLQSNSVFGGFDLGEGNSQTHTFNSGPGVFRVEVSGGQDSARWSMTVEDHY